MIPAALVDSTLEELASLLTADDIVIDGGNSYYIDDIRRASELKTKGIHYVDVGTSGGVWGLERGYCQMIGGEKEVVSQLDPIFKTSGARTRVGSANQRTLKRRNCRRGIPSLWASWRRVISSRWFTMESNTD